MRLVVRRFESIPSDDPTDYVVGFEYTLDNGRVFYLEDMVPIREVAGKSDQQISEAAYAHLQPEAERRAAELAVLSPLIGSEFVPPGTPKSGSKSKLSGQPPSRSDNPPAPSTASIKIGPSKAAERAAQQQADQEAAKAAQE